MNRRLFVLTQIIIFTFVLGSVVASASPAPTTGSSQGSGSSATGGNAPLVLDPGQPGPLRVSRLDYKEPPWRIAGYAQPIEVQADIHYPTGLPGGPYPLIVFLHGMHQTCWGRNIDGQYFTTINWPCPFNMAPIPSYKGYDYVARHIASYGFIVISISANGINGQNPRPPEQVWAADARARAELIQHHLDLWNIYNLGFGFGGRFMGKVDMQKIGTMGHSRGGAGVVKHYALYKGGPYGIKAVMPLAPIDYNRDLITDVPMAVVLPYCDGDVRDLAGVRYFDDSLYPNAPLPDTGPKHTILMMGANHNYFNTVWTDRIQGAWPGTLDDWNALVRFGPQDGFCGYGAATRWTPQKQMAASKVYITAFFLTYLKDPANYFPLLSGESAPPASAGTNNIFVSYYAPATKRVDINRLNNPGDLFNNFLGNPVGRGNANPPGTGLSPYWMCGGVPGPVTAARCLDPFAGFVQEPHTLGSPLPGGGWMPGRTMLSLGWLAPGRFGAAFYTNPLAGLVIPWPANGGSWRVQFRVGLNFRNGLNYVGGAPGFPQNFSVMLRDVGGRWASVPVNNGRLPNGRQALYWPGGGNFTGVVPKSMLNMVAIPLSEFRTANGNLDLTSLTHVKFQYDRQNRNGAIFLADLAFVDASAPALMGPNSPVGDKPAGLPIKLSSTSPAAPTLPALPASNVSSKKSTDQVSSATKVNAVTTPGDCITATPSPTGTPTFTETPTTTPPTDTPTETPTDTETPTETPTDTATPDICGYTATLTGGGVIAPATTDIGIHCDDCSNSIDLPFPFRLYDRTFTSAVISSNGTVQFDSDNDSYSDQCLPDPTYSYTIFAYWQDLDTENAICPDCGVFTSVTGAAPNRIFNIRWRAMLAGTEDPANFEVQLNENRSSVQFRLVYGAISDGGGNASVGVQKDTGSSFTQLECNIGGLTQGSQYIFGLPPCGAFTPTGTPGTDTPTRTPTGTVTPTDTPDLSTATDTATATPTRTPNGVIPTPLATRITIADSITFCDPIQQGMLARDGGISRCDLIPRDCPGYMMGYNPHYKAYTFVNTTGSDKCFTVALATSCSDTNPIFSAAYLGGFDPNNICDNYVADAGFSPDPSSSDPTNPYSFHVPAGETFVVVVHEVIPDVGCQGYTVTVSFEEPTPTPTSTYTPSFTNTPILTATRTPTNTPSVISTITPMSTVTNIASTTPTHASTNMPSITPTHTYMPTFTNTPIVSSTLTPTNTPSVISTITPMSTVTNIATTTPTNASTNTPTRTNTPEQPTSTPTSTFTPTNTPSSTFTNTPTNTSTNTSTPTSTFSNTPTNTPAPSGVINGHLTWQGVSAANRPSVTGTLTLCVSGSPQSLSFATDINGNFTITTGLSDGVYHWRVKGGRMISSSSPADGGDLVVSGGRVSQEFGLQKGGDTINHNIVNTADFNNLKSQFGRNGNWSADFNYDQVVGSSDFNILKGNFGQAGHNLICP